MSRDLLRMASLDSYWGVSISAKSALLFWFLKRRRSRCAPPSSGLHPDRAVTPWGSKGFSLETTTGGTNAIFGPWFSPHWLYCGFEAALRWIHYLRNGLHINNRSRIGRIFANRFGWPLSILRLVGNQELSLSGATYVLVHHANLILNGRGAFNSFGARKVGPRVVV
jgi:hypothetical protein